MRKILCLLFLALSPLYATQETDDYRDRADVEKLLKSIEKITEPSERAVKASEYFLGRPFGDGPLGEGSDGKYDNDPLCRTDQFDCTTYIETVAAVALTRSWNDFTKQMDQIRYYRGDISFLTRNHFPALDWIPNNINEEKIFEDITHEVGGEKLPMARAMIKKRNWYAKFDEKRIKRPDLKPDEITNLLADLRMETEKICDVPATLDYIPFTAVLAFSEDELKTRRMDEAAIRERLKDDKATQKMEIAAYRKRFLSEHPNAVRSELLKKIPSGSFISYVHPDRPLEAFIGTNMIVTHQGLLIWKGNTLYARHTALNDRVIDIPFLEYIDAFTIPGKLDPQGFHLLKLR